MKIKTRAEEDALVAAEALKRNLTKRTDGNLQKTSDTPADDAAVQQQQDGKVQISELARELLSLDTNSDSDEMRMDRVNRLKALIQSGQYKPDSSEVAQKLIEELSSL